MTLEAILAAAPLSIGINLDVLVFGRIYREPFILVTWAGRRRAGEAGRRLPLTWSLSVVSTHKAFIVIV